MKVFSSFTVALFMASLGNLLGACGGGDQPPTPGEEVRSDKQRITNPQVAAEDLAVQVDANTQFAFELYGLLTETQTGNLFFSPHSIEVALAMTYAGARSDTEAAMAEAMNFVLSQAALHPFFNKLDLELASRGEGAEGADDGGFRLKITNGLFGQAGYEFLTEFLDVLAENYDAGMHLMDFVADAVGAARQINAWVEEATEGRIKDLIPEDALSEYTKLVLVNAIYFNAAWSFPFEEEDTQDGVFHTASGEEATVPMMHQGLETGFHLGDGFVAVEMAYDGEQLSMLILLPSDMAGLEAELDGSLLREIRDGMQYGVVSLTMPRFEIKGETFSLKNMLIDLGMELAFTPAADFSGMDGIVGSLMIHDVLHQAFVKVNEKGTEAAAATAVIVGDTGVPPEGPTVVLDRPFLFLIQDRPTGQVLFLGRLNDPR